MSYVSQYLLFGFHCHPLHIQFSKDLTTLPSLVHMQAFAAASSTDENTVVIALHQVRIMQSGHGMHGFNSV